MIYGGPGVVMRMMWVTTSMMMSARGGMRLVLFGRHAPGDNECFGGDVGIVSLHANGGVPLGGRSWAWLSVEVWRVLFKLAAKSVDLSFLTRSI